MENETIKPIINFEIMKEYSENPTLLKQILSEIKITAKFLKCGLYFSDDKKSRNIYSITIKRGSKRISYKYGDSINNTIKGIPLDAYSILATCVMEYYCPDDFDEFCSEYGYNNDSRKAERIFKNALKLSAKLHEIFSDDEANALPR